MSGRTIFLFDASRDKQSPIVMNSSRERHLHSLTPLRGLAALWVVFYHYGAIYFPNLQPERYTHVLEKGYLAVDLFFLLSGFVMSHVYHESFSGDIGRNYWNFLGARVARLYPLHVLVLLLFFATDFASRTMAYVVTGTFPVWPLEGARSLVALAANLLMLQGLQASELSWNYPAWSISVEFVAYLGFPFALLLVRKGRPAVKLLIAAAVFAALIILAYLTGDDFNQWDGPQTLLRCLPEFLIGVLLYNVFRTCTSCDIIGQSVVVLTVLFTVIALLHFGAPDLLIVGTFAVLMLAAVANTGIIAEAINIRPLVWLGDISYSLYLFHGFIQFFTTKLLEALGIPNRADLSSSRSLAITGAMIAVSLVLAHVSFYGIEVRMRRSLRELLRIRAPASERRAPQ